MILGLLFLAMLAQEPQGFIVDGQVLDSISGKPLSRVRLTLEEAGSVKVGRVTNSSPDGRFRFEGVPEGKYALLAVRLGYSAQAYGQKSLASPYSTGVVVASGEKTRGLTFQMIPWSAVSGAVKDANGDPAVGVSVQALLLKGAGGKTERIPAKQTSTDDRGHYRLHSMPSGSYVLLFTGPGWREETLRTESGKRGGYPARFFPGVPDIDSAEELRVSPGAEVNANITLPIVTKGSIEGRIGRPGKYAVLLVVPGIPSMNSGDWRHSTSTEGEVTIPDVAQGRYQLLAFDGQNRFAGNATVTVEEGTTKVRFSEATPARLQIQVVDLAKEKKAAPNAVILQGVGGPYRDVLALEADGTANFEAVPPGPCRVSLLARKPVAVLSMEQNGKRRMADFLDVPETGSLEVRMVVDSSATEVEGRVVRGDVPQSGVLVALVPEKDIENVGRYRFDQTNSDGSFTWPGVAPGSYLMFAFEQGEASDYANAEAIRARLPEGLPLVVGSGKRQDVKLDLGVRQ